jgi:hypothetical protein
LKQKEKGGKMVEDTCVMKVKLMEAGGMSSALYGLGLSYGLTSPHESWAHCPGKLQRRLCDKAIQLAPKTNGESKFCESVILWIKVTGPRYWWQEADTYRLSSKQSDSTMHTFKKDVVGLDVDGVFKMFEPRSCTRAQAEAIMNLVKEDAPADVVKRMIPEGFLQTREWCMSLSTFRRIIGPRWNHRLPHWRMFIQQVLDQLDPFCRRVAQAGFEQFEVTP